MRYYLDSSAIIKRVLIEDGSADLAAMLATLRRMGGTFVTSELGEVEVARALRQSVSQGRLSREGYQTAWDTAFSGIDTVGLTHEVLVKARSIGADELRTLDAIHLAAAWVGGADVIITYDERLLRAGMDVGLATAQAGVRNPTLPPGWGWIEGGED